MAETTFLCKRPWTGFEVEHDGTVRPCCMTKVNTCGNINQQSIEEIWNGETFQRIRQQMASGQWDQVCRADCPRLHGDMTDPIPEYQSLSFGENCDLSETEIRERLTILKSKPRFWKLTHSTRCNIDCIMCYQDRNDLRHLPETFYEDIIKFQPYIQEMIMIGGETLAIKRFRKFLQFFAESDEYPNLWFSIVTNGTVHDDETLNLIRRINVSWISISVDAATKDTYAHIRRGGDFEHTCKGIERLTQLGREKNTPVMITFTAMKDNVTEIADFVRLAIKYKTDCLFGKVFGEKGGQDKIDPVLFRSSLEEAIAISAPYKDEMRFTNLTLNTLMATVEIPTGE